MKKLIRSLYFALFLFSSFLITGCKDIPTNPETAELLPADELTSNLAKQSSITIELLPVAFGTIFDQSPFDGIGDLVGGGFLVVFTPSIAEARAVAEFDLSSINPRSIQNASLSVVPIGLAFSTPTLPVELFGYVGDGSIQTDDFNVGSSIGGFDARAVPLGVPVLLDVTGFLQGQDPLEFVGFNLRLNIGGQVNHAAPPTLIVELAAVSQVDIDIKPQSCPNPLNTKSKGVLPVAVLGTASLDVNDIDVSTVQLEGVDPIRSDIEDVATPVANRQDDCDCTTAGPDGFDDLTLKFDTQAIVAALGPVNDGDEVKLTLTGNLNDGTAITGLDCVVIKKK